MNRPYGGPLPRLIAWEITRRCPLSCRHCRASAADRAYAGELSTGECLEVLENIASFARPIMILTGGEPMMRADIYELARAGSELGLRMVMAPCGLLVDETAVRRMREAGIRRISLSIDGADEATHDAFRGEEGAFRAVIGAARLARAAGLEFQVNTTVTRLNVDQLERILALAVELGAVGFHPFLLVPTGRARTLADLEISPLQYERVLGWLYERSLAAPITIKPTCAPHYYRILRQRAGQAGRSGEGRGAEAGRAGATAGGVGAEVGQAGGAVGGAGASAGQAGQAAGARGRPDTRGMDAAIGGCLGGRSFAFISHTGRIQICGFLDLEAGDLRREGLDFRRIWEGSALFAAMRDPDGYRGKCGRCEFRRGCGGCRARAYAATGDWLAEEPYCVYRPAGRGEGR